MYTLLAIALVIVGFGFIAMVTMAIYEDAGLLWGLVVVAFETFFALTLVGNLAFAPTEIQFEQIGEARGVKVDLVTYPGPRVPAWSTTTCRIENTTDRPIRVEAIERGSRGGEYTDWVDTIREHAVVEREGRCPRIKVYSKKGALLALIS